MTPSPSDADILSGRYLRGFGLPKMAKINVTPGSPKSANFDTTSNITGPQIPRELSLPFIKRRKKKMPISRSDRGFLILCLCGRDSRKALLILDQIDPS